MFTDVYGPVLNEERECFWNELSDIRGLWNDPWCVGGDFNVVRFSRERRNCFRSSGSMRLFQEVIEDLELKDLPLFSGSFTWCGGLNKRLAFKLDRLLVSNDWEDHFNDLFQSILPKLVLDHAPILLDGRGDKDRKNFFRFETCG